MNRVMAARRAASATALLMSIVVACGGTPGTLGPATPPSGTGGASVAATASVKPPTAAPTTTRAFPIAAFSSMSAEPVSPAVAKTYQKALDHMAEGGGMAATVLTAAGSWSGATGMADGVRAMTIDDQFAINSITKSVVAAQVMQLVEAGELRLDEPAGPRLPPDLGFDTNGATIRNLLEMRSGIPDYDNGALLAGIKSEPKYRWTPAELLLRVPKGRAAPGGAFDYSSTNYVLLGMIVEHVRRRPLADVLRHGVLKGDGFERLVFEPDETPTPPLAMPGDALTSTLKERGGYLPSMNEASAGFGAFAMASDSASLARWWRALCAGEVVSQASLTAMSTFRDADRYGLGIFDIAEGYARSVGHAGWSSGYVSWAGCLLDDHSVVVVLANYEVDDIGGMARPLVEAARRN